MRGIWLAIMILANFALSLSEVRGADQVENVPDDWSAAAPKANLKLTGDSDRNKIYIERAVVRRTTDSQTPASTIVEYFIRYKFGFHSGGWLSDFHTRSGGAELTGIPDDLGFCGLRLINPTGSHDAYLDVGAKTESSINANFLVGLYRNNGTSEERGVIEVRFVSKALLKRIDCFQEGFRKASTYKRGNPVPDYSVLRPSPQPLPYTGTPSLPSLPGGDLCKVANLAICK